MAQGNLQDKQKVNKMIEVLKILAMQFESVYVECCLAWLFASKVKGTKKAQIH